MDSTPPSFTSPPPGARPRPSSFKNSLKSEAVRAEWRRTAWSRCTAAWMLVSTALIWCAAGSSWLIYFFTPKAAPIAFNGGKTLHDATRAWIGDGIRPDYDQLNLFLNATLPALYQFTPEGAPFRPFIKGMVSPNLIAAADASFVRELELVRKKGICQIFCLSTVKPDDLLFDRGSKRVCVTVRAEFEVTFKNDPSRGAVHIPYLAKIILTPNVPSAVNPFSFYIQEISKT